MKDLSRLEWRSEGSTRNQTEWMDSSELDFEAKEKDRGVLSAVDLEELGIRGFSVRFTILPVSVDKVTLYGGIIPMSRVDLEAKLGEMETDLDSELIPTVAMKLGFARGKYQNGTLLDLLPAEEVSHGVGFGTFPLLETIGSAEPTFPESSDVAAELFAFLRGMSANNNMNPARLHNVFAAGTLAATPTGVITYEWPEYVARSETESRAQSGLSDF